MSVSDKKEKGMTLIVKSTVRLVAGFIFIFGIYIVLHGHITPGGGFSGGLIIALSFILFMLAFGEEAALRRLSEAKASLLEGIGALLFLSLGVLGFLKGQFFVDIITNKGKPFDILSAGFIPFYNTAIAIKVAVGLFSVFIVLVILGKTKR
ncbi:MAG: MnhB domain-containing protein [Candidatus Omnitrophica bacterium]|nr:MnhB domain-containing protein [Candidatus Omnitrophota bacterium]